MSAFDEYWKEVVPVMWDVETWDNKSIKTVARLAFDAGRDHDRAKYNQLLYSVERKFPDETRHETALRYIREAERGQSESIPGVVQTEL